MSAIVFGITLVYCGNDLIVPFCRLSLTFSSFISATIREWNKLDDSVRNLDKLSKFKKALVENNLKKNVPKHYSYGSRKLNIILSQIRCTASFLNSDLYRVNIVQSASCSCGALQEDANHYFFECYKYTEIRNIMIQNLRQYSVPVNLELLTRGRVYCNGTAGRLGTCWNYTLAGETAVGHVPSIMGFGSADPITYHCTENGTWDIHGENFTSYDVADPETIGDGHGHVYVFIAGNAVSILLLSIALVIFFSFRQLRCGRVLIHKNLFLSYVFTGMTWILYNKLAILDGDVLMTNPWWCQALHVLAQYFMLCNFAWMFCEGLYLHTVLTRVFSNAKTLTFLCYAIGWGYPIIPTIIYTVLRLAEEAENQRCWYEESSLQWIMYGPIVVSICINVIFLINIVRLLMTKLQKIPEASQSKKAARATLVLVPLLGIQYLVLPMRPQQDTELENIYLYSIAVLTSLQGSFVSIFYCFCNSEIISILKRKWNQHWLMYGSGRRKHRCSSTHYTVTENMGDNDCSKKYSDKPEMVPLQDRECEV